MLAKAAAAWQRNEHDQSIEILKRASQMAPDEHRILLDLGRCYGSRFDYAAAEQCFEKAIRVSRWDTSAFITAGTHSTVFNQHEMAKNYFERALKKNAGSPEVLVELEKIYERQNQLATATEFAEQALRLNADCRPALLARARLHRLSGQKDEAEKLLRSFVTKQDRDFWTHAEAWYELGRILDSQSRYDEAMTAFLEAKALLRPNAEKPFAIQQGIQVRMRKTAESISTDLLQRWFEAGDTLKPVHKFCVLGGHPRSGTTLLEQVLDSHPEITSAEETEIFKNEAFGPFIRGGQIENILQILDSASPHQLQQSRENYFRLIERFLGKPIGDKLLIDKNPSLTAMIPPIIRIFPETKFLVALRDPRDVCLSCFMQALQLNPVSSTYLSLQTTVHEYASLMGFWRAIMPKMRNPHLEVRYEDLVEDLESMARRTLEFLGVPWDARVLGFDKHAQTKVVRSPTYADVKKPIYKGAIGRWQNYQKYLEPYLGQLEPFAKAFGYE